jgi:catechol 2,3-dioxygenase-like lactoylglutathione lyase family enzyme
VPAVFLGYAQADAGEKLRQIRIFDPNWWWTSELSDTELKQLIHDQISKSIELKEACGELGILWVDPNSVESAREERMDIAMAAPRSLLREISVAAGKPILRGIHHLALVTDNMRMTLDFYVRVLGMPIVHGLRTPSRPAAASHAHGNGAPPHSNIPHYFLDMGGDSLLAFFEYPEGIAKVDRDAIGAMQHVSFACGPKRYHEILERLKANGVAINAGPLLVIPPAIHSFYFFDPNGVRLEITSDLEGDDEDLQVIRSCSMNETELRAELETISTDRAWIDEMVAAMTPAAIDTRDTPLPSR